MATLVLLNVTPFHIHCSKLKKPPDEWPHRLSANLRRLVTNDQQQHEWWGSDIYTKPVTSVGSGDHVPGRPVGICVRHIDAPFCGFRVCHDPALVEVETWDTDTKGKVQRAGVLVKRLESFQGRCNLNTESSFDMALRQPLFRDSKETLFFLQILMRLAAAIKSGITRVYSAMNAKLVGLLQAHGQSSQQPGPSLEYQSPLHERNNEKTRSTNRKAAPAGVGTRDIFFASEDPCLNPSLTFGEWLHRACCGTVGVLSISKKGVYSDGRHFDFSIFRHAAKHDLLSELMACQPLARLQGFVSGAEFTRSTPGSTGFKRHAVWVAPLPLNNFESSWDVWEQGGLHLITGASSTGHTRLKLDPAFDYDGFAVALVLPYVGNWEAMYESWCHAERKGPPYPEALEILFGGEALSNVCYLYSVLCLQDCVTWWGRL